jgi:hypothetical protein
VPLPTDAEIWYERLRRELDERDERGNPRRIADPVIRELLHQLLPVERPSERGDRHANRLAVLRALADHLGVDPPPADVATGESARSNAR